MQRSPNAIVAATGRAVTFDDVPPDLRHESARATRDGFELQLGTNHLGHFALTGLLLDRLLPVPGSRIVTVSSLGHRIRAQIRFDDLQWERSYDRVAAYGQSKLANLMFTYELQRRLNAHGATTIAVAAHPGFAQLGRGGPDGLQRRQVEFLDGEVGAGRGFGDPGGPPACPSRRRARPAPPPPRGRRSRAERPAGRRDRGQHRPRLRDRPSVPGGIAQDRPDAEFARWEAGVRALSQRVALISIEPDWAKLLDFETTIPLTTTPSPPPTDNRWPAAPRHPGRPLHTGR
jgi:NAD(P)-dependent dehydrogenase (short-subunit alcohol dehydrogenase family)